MLAVMNPEEARTMCGAELKPLPDGVQRVAAALQAKGHPHAPQMLGESCRTAQEAADTLGVAVGQIAKSIIFKRKSDNLAVLVIASGDRRVDEKKVDALVGKTGRADAEFVREAQWELARLRTRGLLANGTIGSLTLCAFMIGLTIILLFLGETTAFKGESWAIVTFLFGVFCFMLALSCFLAETWMATRILNFGRPKF